MGKKIFLGFAVLFSELLFPQWVSNSALNNAICVNAYNQINVKLTSDMKGGAIAVWEDFRNDPGQNDGDIYIQRISKDGIVKWTANGIAVCADIANQANPSIVSDSLGGAIIVWEDDRGSKRNLYVQRVDSLGIVSWAANGLQVTSRNNEQKNARIISDQNNGAIIFWQDSVVNGHDIYGQRFNNGGAQLWSNGVAVCSQSGSQLNPKAQIASTGDIFVTWQDKRSGVDYDIYAQKLNLSGVSQWAANGISLCNVFDTQSNPKVVLDNTGGAIIAWQDKRGGVSYDIYAQRVNASGVAYWALNGVVVCNAVGSQSAVDMTSQYMNNGTIIAWKDARKGLSNIDVYAQMLNLNGAAQWTANGIAVAGNNYNQLSTNVIGDGSGGAIISYQDSSSGTWDIKSLRISSTGTLLWTLGGVSVASAVNHQTNHHDIGDAVGGSIYGFQDTRSGNSDIYVFKLDMSGKPVGVKQITDIKTIISVYPNPSSEKITFYLPSSMAKWSLQIFDLNGCEMVNEFIENTDKFELAKGLRSGIYFYNIYNNVVNEKGKLIIINHE